MTRDVVVRQGARLVVAGSQCNDAAAVAVPGEPVELVAAARPAVLGDRVGADRERVGRACLRARQRRTRHLGGRGVLHVNRPGARQGRPAVVLDHMLDHGQLRQPSVRDRAGLILAG